MALPLLATCLALIALLPPSASAQSHSGAPASSVYVIDAALLAQVVDSEDWSAPVLTWVVKSSLRGAAPPSSALPVDGIVEGVADTYVDANETHVLERTVVTTQGGVVVEVEVEADVIHAGARLPSASARRFHSTAVKWLVASTTEDTAFGASASRDGRRVVDGCALGSPPPPRVKVTVG